VISADKQGLIYLFLTHRLYREQLEIEESYTDGGNDCGIDAVYIDRRGDSPIVHLFQSKVHDSERRASNPFKHSIVDRFLPFLEILKDRSIVLNKVVNPKLEQKIFEIRQLQDREFPIFKYWILSNGLPCVQHSLAPIKKRLADLEVELLEFHLNDFVEFCLNAHSQKTSHTFLREKLASWNMAILN
jgi:hypothetical protein